MSSSEESAPHCHRGPRRLDSQLTEGTTLFLEAGPRVNDEGDWGVDATARLDHQFRNGGVFLSYVRTDQLVVGRAGASTTNTGSLGVSYYPPGNLVLSAPANVIHIPRGQQRAR